MYLLFGPSGLHDMRHFMPNTYFPILTCLIGKYHAQNSQYVDDSGAFSGMESAFHPPIGQLSQVPPVSINQDRSQIIDYNTALEAEQYAGVYNSYGQEDNGPSVLDFNPMGSPTLNNGNRWQCIQRFESSTSGKINKFEKKTFGMAWVCKGNNESYPDKMNCDAECMPELYTDPTTHHGYCLLPEDPGECRAFKPMWFYDYTTQRCRPFGYGGCGGNKNRFGSEQECLKTCQGQGRSRPDLQPRPDLPDFPGTGIGNGMQPRPDLPGSGIGNVMQPRPDLPGSGIGIGRQPRPDLPGTGIGRFPATALPQEPSSSLPMG